MATCVSGRRAGPAGSTLDSTGQPKFYAKGVTNRVDIAIDGMSCASCVAKVERALDALPGVEASVNLVTSRATVTTTEGVTSQALTEAIKRVGYSGTIVSWPGAVNTAVAESDADQSADARPGAAGLWDRLSLPSALICALVVALISMIGQLQFAGWQWLTMALSGLITFGFGWPIIKSAATSARHLTTSMNTLIAVGAISAWGISTSRVIEQAFANHPSGHLAHSLYFEVAAVVVAAVLLGRWIEDRAKVSAGSARQHLLDLTDLQVTIAYGDGSPTAKTVHTSKLKRGDLFCIMPGQVVACDGEVFSGSSQIDESLITGEPGLVTKVVGSTVSAGSINGDGALAARATVDGDRTSLSQLIHSVDEALAVKGSTQKLVDSVSAVFVPLILLTAGVTLFGWLAVGQSFDQALSRSIAVLVVACPCALGLATPTALLAAAGAGAKAGILIRNPVAIESAGKLTKVAFDKTGTLTGAQMQVVEIAPEFSSIAAQVIELAQALERHSNHPIAKAICAYQQMPPESRTSKATGLLSISKSTTQLVASNVQQIQANGIVAQVESSPTYVGTTDWVQDNCGPMSPQLAARVTAANESGQIVVLVGQADCLVGMIALADPPKSTSADAITQLKALNIQPVLITGDSEPAARWLANEVGIESVHARCTPQHKLDLIDGWQNANETVAMVGDGINDTAALSKADLGIALGTGTDAAQAAADLTLVSGDPLVAVKAIKLSRRTNQVIRQNLGWAFLYNLILIPLAIFGIASPMLAGIAMAASSVLVVSNSLRLRSSNQNLALVQQIIDQ